MDDVKIARGPTTQAGLAVSRRSQTRPGINPSWNAQLDLRGLLLSAGAAAGTARSFNHAAGTLAMRTGLGNAENAA